MNPERGPHYHAYLVLLRHLHQLLSEGRGESEAADVLRDEMDVHWERMTAEEVESANAYSERLYHERAPMLQARSLCSSRERVRRRYMIPRKERDAA